VGIEENRVWELINRYREYRQKGLVWNILLFGRILKELGLQITVSRLLDAVKSLALIDLRKKEDFCYALQSNLVSSPAEISTFLQVFHIFWTNWEELKEEERTSVSRSQQEGSPFEQKDTSVLKADKDDDSIPPGDSEEKREGHYYSYSPQEVLQKKDFSSFQAEDTQAFRELLTYLLPKLATRFSRRKQVHPKGIDLDLRKTLRKTVRYGGDIVDLVQKRRKIKKTRLTLLCDVSGSMDCYSRFLIQFMYGLQNKLPQLDTFVFSTRLSRISHLLKGRDIEQALAKVSEIVLDWSGGTAIGSCLKSFNEQFMQAKAPNKTVVIIISDGWDRGDTELLAQEMRRLHQKAYKVLWLNPLLGSPSYQPLCKGIQAALPHIDYFLPAHNLESLVKLCKELGHLV
jgi:hypothetical protein